MRQSKNLGNFSLFKTSGNQIIDSTDMIAKSPGGRAPEGRKCYRKLNFCDVLKHIEGEADTKSLVFATRENGNQVVVTIFEFGFGVT